MGGYSESSDGVFEVAGGDRDGVLGVTSASWPTCSRVRDRKSLAGLLSNPGSQLVWLKI